MFVKCFFFFKFLILFKVSTHYETKITTITTDTNEQYKNLNDDDDGNNYDNKEEQLQLSEFVVVSQELNNFCNTNDNKTSIDEDIPFIDDESVDFSNDNNYKDSLKYHINGLKVCY